MLLCSQLDLVEDLRISATNYSTPEDVTGIDFTMPWNEENNNRILDALSAGMVSLSSIFSDIRNINETNHRIVMVNELNYTSLQLGGIAEAIKSSSLDGLIQPSPLKKEQELSTTTVTMLWCPGDGPVNWVTKSIGFPSSEKSVSTYSFSVVDTLTSTIPSVQSSIEIYSKTSELLLESDVFKHSASKLLPTVSSYHPFIFSSEKSPRAWTVSEPRVTLTPYGLTRDGLEFMHSTPIYHAETSSLGEYLVSETSVQFQIKDSSSAEPFITSTMDYKKISSPNSVLTATIGTSPYYQPSISTISNTESTIYQPQPSRSTISTTESTIYQPSRSTISTTESTIYPPSRSTSSTTKSTTESTTQTTTSSTIHQPETMEQQLKNCYENDVKVNDNFLENSVAVQMSSIRLWRQFAVMHLFKDLHDRTLTNCYKEISGTSPLSTVPSETVESLKKFDKLSGLIIAVMELGHCHNVDSRCTSMEPDLMSRRLGAARLVSKILLEKKKVFLPNGEDSRFDVDPLKYGLNYAALSRMSFLNEIREVMNYLYDDSRISDNMPMDHLGALLAYRYRATDIILKHRKFCTITSTPSSSFTVSSTYGSVVHTTNLPRVEKTFNSDNYYETLSTEYSKTNLIKLLQTSVLTSSTSESTVNLEKIPNYYPISLSEKELFDLIFS